MKLKGHAFPPVIITHPLVDYIYWSSLRTRATVVFKVSQIFKMQLEEILSELENNNGIFPRLALEKAIENREAMTPLLLATLEKYKNNLEELLDKPDYILHIYALYLLAQFREPLAYPLIVEFFSAPGEITLDVTGDIVTEDLGKILASVSGGNIDPIKQLVENQQANEFVRSAALKSLVILVAQGMVSREQVIQYFEELFSTLLEKKPDYIWTNLVVYSSQLCSTELKEHIEQLFEEDFIDTFFIEQEDVDDYFQLGSEAALTRLREHPHYSLIEDTISGMESWACFQQENSQKPSPINLALKEFTFSSNQPKNQAKKKKKMQKESRRKNRPKKK